MHIKTANGKRKLAISRKEWLSIGKTAGWTGQGRYTGGFPFTATLSAGEEPEAIFITADYPDDIPVHRAALSEMTDWVEKFAREVAEENYPSLKKLVLKIRKKGPKDMFQIVEEEEILLG